MQRIEDPVLQVRDALLRGELGAAELSARRLGARFGKTTSLLYHHYGSLDGFLFAVAQAGLRILGERLAAARPGGLPEVAVAFVRAGLEAPALYALMFERRFDWAALRRAGALDGELPGRRLFTVLCEELRRAGADNPRRDARILYAGLHGLISLALSGRANVGDPGMSDEDAAIDAARELARRLCPAAAKGTPDADDDPRSAAAAGRSRAAKPPGQGVHERVPGRPGRRAR